MDPKNRLFPSEIRKRLNTRLIGKRIYYYPEVDSTNRAAQDLARMGEPQGTLVLCDYQTGGRGRRDHVWSSPAGQDLLFSLVLRPKGDFGFILPSTLAFSLSISTSLSEMLDIDAGVKWPNDIVSREGKIGGILAESSTSGTEFSSVVLGVGINVNSRKEDFPAEFRARAASCRSLTGRAVDRLAVLSGVLTAMESCYQSFQEKGFPAFRKSYEKKMFIIGRNVSFERNRTRVVGEVSGVDTDGSLLVVVSGESEPVALYNEVVTEEP